MWPKNNSGEKLKKDHITKMECMKLNITNYTLINCKKKLEINFSRHIQYQQKCLIT